MRKILLLCLVLVFALSAGSALAARSGGTLNYMAPYGGDLFGLDPHTSSRVQDYLVEMDIHKGLYKWDPYKSVPVLELPESVKVSDDGMVYTYKLRPNIKFHNGRQLVSDDVIFSFNRIMKMKPASSASRFIYIIKGAKDVQEGKSQEIAGLKKIDDLTFEMTLENPVDPKYFLFWTAASILPKEEVAREDFAVNPVGCGPFKFSKWIKGSKVELVKNPDYYMPGKPYLDKVVFNIMGESAARDLAFKAKELDAIIVGAVHYPEYLKDPVISKNMVEVAEMFTRHVGMNPKFKPFSNKKVRQAINYAIPTDLIIKKVLKNKAFAPRGWLPSSSPAFDPKGKKYEYNPEKAKQLMKEAGYEKGFTVEKCLGTANKSWGVGIYEAAMPYLKKIGITLKIQQMEGAAFAERVRNGDYDMYIWSIGSGPNTLDVLTRWVSSTPQAAGNYVQYSNPEYDALVKKASAERDFDKQNELFKQANAIMTEDAPFWFFNYNKAIMAFQPWVHGIAPVAVEMMYQDLTEVWVDEKSPRANAK